ncbi:hypothetical protein IEQ34_002028 [Dendrobium chrysotoxum]|uniref:Uncharacterized protein n=1 Tax=Dendrobium chrysotoxum TaxID=161865 RepID=A0AAV7HIH3_DENCH|nr:hypothetical protein IEQ34_002028 [Dendrobium chrysotoxum]
MYWTMMSDSQIGLPWWIRTGIFLCTGFDFSRSSLFSPRIRFFSSLYSYSTSFSANAILVRTPKGLTQKSSSFTSFSDAIALSARPLWLSHSRKCLEIATKARCSMECVLNVGGSGCKHNFYLATIFDTFLHLEAAFYSSFKKGVTLRFS